MKRSSSAPSLTQNSSSAMKRNVSANAMQQILYMVTVPVHRVLDCSLAQQQRFPSDILGSPDDVTNMGLCLAEPSTVPDDDFPSMPRQCYWAQKQVDEERYMSLFSRIRRRNREREREQEQEREQEREREREREREQERATGTCNSRKAI